MRNVENELKNVNEKIERNIRNFSSKYEEECTQDILSDLRTFTEHCAMYIVHGGKYNVEDNYYAEMKNLFPKHKPANCHYSELYDLHRLLQMVTSHYVPSLESCPRLMRKYIDYLFIIKKMMKDCYKIELLKGLETINFYSNNLSSQFYEKVAQTIENCGGGTYANTNGCRFYVWNRKPFIVNYCLYYEYILVPAKDKLNKFDHITMFSRHRIPNFNAVSVVNQNTTIDMFNIDIPIQVIVDYEISIRPVELMNIKRIFNPEIKRRIKSTDSEYIGLMNFMKSNNTNLLEIVSMDSNAYKGFVEGIKLVSKNHDISNLLDDIKSIIDQKTEGYRILSYLVCFPRNYIIKDQISDEKNPYLSDLYLYNECIPFEKHPFCTALKRHEVKFSQLIKCFSIKDFEADLLARFISNAMLKNQCLYINDDLIDFSEEHLNRTIKCFNDSLYSGHKKGQQDRQIIHRNNYLYINGEEYVLKKIKEIMTEYSSKKIEGIGTLIAERAKLANSSKYNSEKIKLSTTLFHNSQIGIINGFAGTGKTTFIELMCELLNDHKIIAIAVTNPAVENLKRRLTGKNVECMTVNKYIYSHKSCELLIIDESSTLCNRDMLTILKKEFSLLLCVGDPGQIEPIQFGNWFKLCRDFIPRSCRELKEQNRVNGNSTLDKLWREVRSLPKTGLTVNNVTEILTVHDYESKFDESVYKRNSDDEIILCERYDGLFGINSINRIMQTSNSNKAIKWVNHTYKKDDPILFTDNDHFRPIFYNNLKGKIVEIKKGKKSIDFTIKISAPYSSLQVNNIEGLSFIENDEKSTTVKMTLIEPTKEDLKEGNFQDVPFQVAYAVSIHKSQGLEYDSVKILIDDDVDETFNLNLFYTSITRTRNLLKIYWSPATEKTLLFKFSEEQINKDLEMLKKSTTN